MLIIFSNYNLSNLETELHYVSNITGCKIQQGQAYLKIIAKSSEKIKKEKKVTMLNAHKLEILPLKIALLWWMIRWALLKQGISSCEKWKKTLSK